MSSYKPGYSEARSPAFDQGTADADRDKSILANCPPGYPIGPTPPNPAYPSMYLRGYTRGMIGAMPHMCGPGCPNWRP